MHAQDAPPTSSQPTLLFMHIPKTGGTSLRASLGELYGPHERAYVYESADMDGVVDPSRFAQLPESERASLRLVMGHFGYGIHRHIPGASRYVTVLRDPVDRIASLFFHYKANAAPRPGSRGYEERLRIAESGMTLEDWALGGQRPEADNQMVRMIAPRSMVPFGQCPDDMLTEAFEHIEADFDAVLVHGLMRQGVEVLEHIVGTSMPPVRRLNVNAQREPLETLDPGVMARIRELNHLDSELYRRTVERFPGIHRRYAGRP